MCDSCCWALMSTQSGRKQTVSTMKKISWISYKPSLNCNAEGQVKHGLLSHYYILMRSKMGSRRKHSEWCDKEVITGAQMIKSWIWFWPCSHHQRITSHWALWHCIRLAFVMEIDAGMDESKSGGWDGRGISTKLKCHATVSARSLPNRKCPFLVHICPLCNNFTFDHT